MTQVRENPFALRTCPKCDYDLRGQVEAHCPECGFQYESGAVAVYGWLPGRQPGIGRIIVVGLLLLLLATGAWPFTGRPFQSPDLIGFFVITVVFITLARLVRNAVRRLNERTEVCALLGPTGFTTVIAGREPRRYAWRRDHRLRIDLNGMFWVRLSIVEHRPGLREDVVRLDLMFDGSRREINEVERMVTEYMQPSREAGQRAEGSGEFEI